jgi:hypothetical protein
LTFPLHDVEAADDDYFVTLGKGKDAFTEALARLA